MIVAHKFVDRRNVAQLGAGVMLRVANGVVHLAAAIIDFDTMRKEENETKTNQIYYWNKIMTFILWKSWHIDLNFKPNPAIVEAKPLQSSNNSEIAREGVSMAQAIYVERWWYMMQPFLGFEPFNGIAHNFMHRP